MSTVNYEDLYEEFLLLTSSSSSSSPSVGDQSSPPPKQQQLPGASKEQMPESNNLAEQQLQSQPEESQNMSEYENANGVADKIPSQHFLAQCSPRSPTPTPTTNIVWGGTGHSPQMCHLPPQNLNNYFNQQQFMTNHHQHQQFITSHPQHQQFITNHHQHQQHSQQQSLSHHQQHQSQNASQQICQQYQQQQQQMINTINLRSNHWDNQPFPGGLNELWRNLPAECQKYLTPQDVPESARFRGYFTVCELLVLKRNLLGRYTGSVEENNDDEIEKVVGSGSGTQNSSSHKNGSKKRKRVPERIEDEQQVDDAELQASCEVTVTVGVAVKEALDALDEEQQQQSQGNSNSLSLNLPIQEQNAPSTETVTQIITQTCGSTNVTQHQGQGSTTVPQKVTMGPPPPYRTAQLVFKLLQIGNYQLRSFADLTPNKFKVLYNTQRIIYECQLPIVLPQREDMQPLRKLLTIDIGFDQISFVRFGNDKMFLKVDGAPLLTVTYNAITDDETSSPVSFQEQQLLDQIDRGQLKLSPCHQVFFINERLVHMLESQFRDHPRLKHLLFQNNV